MNYEDYKQDEDFVNVVTYKVKLCELCDLVTISMMSINLW